VKYTSTLSLHGCAAETDLALCMDKSLLIQIMLGREFCHQGLIMREGTVSCGFQDLKEVLILDF